MSGVAVTIAVVIIILVVAVLLFGKLRTSVFFTVKTQENVVVERFGKFKKVARPGLNTKVPFIETTSRPISLRVQQLEVNIESKTKDNVFVTVPVAVQYVVEEDNVADAYYRLANSEEQIRSYVFDTVRSALSGLTLDTAFESKDDIAENVERRLSESMKRYGFKIVSTLVTDITPDQRVRDSMNSINAAQRDKVAAQSLAEADKIKRVTQAQAESEAMRLHGEGVAAQRKAIATGIAEQYAKLQEVGIDKTAEQLLMMTQYFDTMQNVAQEGRSNVLFMPSNPGGLGEMGQEIRNALFAANAADEGSHLPAPQGRDDAGGDSRSSSGNGADGTNVPPQPTTPPADRSGQYAGGQGQGGSRQGQPGQGRPGQGQSQHGGQGHSDPRSAAQSAVRAAAEQWRNRRGGNQG
ncbi:SPFH domain-containing protein [Brevibacterium linens]|uniref:Regulator of protease activity HflC, stomatin/prohibitin superfamily n=1 Tax=Brevibacterium linens TaxID=1703 RepID=A0A2H1JMB3_BRELN|nr:SPFH domain-containing protein [Brevibacterium linens]SMX88610.1 Regulator of protease activity HflC, stomatin/prohibitin superfamily [Brevibacterium linens]